MSISQYTLFQASIIFAGGFILVIMIVKRKNGYFVLSESTKRNLGGPYVSRAKAIKRLRQVEFFKHLKK